MKKRIIVFSLSLLVAISPALLEAKKNDKSITGKVIMFHAGSLSMPFDAMEKEFEKLYPGVDLQREASGSQAAARKITDLGKECDLMASADYDVIDKLQIGRAHV